MAHPVSTVKAPTNRCWWKLDEVLRQSLTTRGPGGQQLPRKDQGTDVAARADQEASNSPEKIKAPMSTTRGPGGQQLPRKDQGADVAMRADQGASNLLWDQGAHVRGVL